MLATEKQKKWMDDLKINYDAGTTVGDASKLIESAIASGKKSVYPEPTVIKIKGFKIVIQVEPL